MDWQDEFRGLRNIGEQIRQRREEEYRKAELERKNLIKKFGPRIERVCKALAKEVGWNWEDYQDLCCFRIRLSPRMYESYKSILVGFKLPKFEVPNKITPDKIASETYIYVETYIYTPGRREACNESKSYLCISLSEFDEKKLANALKNAYKKSV